jgi:predicted dehydrogenase
MTAQPVKIAVIGVGYLGHYHAEKYAALANSQLVAVCDIDHEVADKISKANNCQAISDYKQLIGQVDAVSIVTPTPLHHEIAKFFLENNVHVFVEKPITTTLEEADELIEIAKSNKLALQVGHLERFNNAILGVKETLNSPRFIESTRLAPFQTRGSDVSVILDLMIHDIDIIEQLAQSEIKSISATGASVLSNKIDICNARLQFENGCIANVTASRINLKKVRIMRVFQQESYYTINLDNKSVRSHYKGDDPSKAEILSEEIIYEQGDALLTQAENFLSAVQNNTQPVVSGSDGRRALATAIAITKKITEDQNWKQT